MFSSSKSTFAAMPVVLLGLLVPGLDGGTSPGEVQSAVAMNASPRSVQFGQKVRLSGVSRTAPGALIRITVRSQDGRLAQLRSVRASRLGTWTLRYLPHESLTFRAETASMVFPASAGGREATVRVRPVLSVQPVALAVGGRPAVARFQILPAASRQVWLEQKSARRWNAVSSVVTNRAGKGAIAVRGNLRSEMRIRAEAASGFDTAQRSFRVARLRPAGASWYGLYGDPVACGGVLHVRTIGVAHKTLPCGTKVTIRYRGRTIVAPVIDRGPYISGREFDLTGAAAKALHFDGVDTIWVSP